MIEVGHCGTLYFRSTELLRIPSEVVEAVKGVTSFRRFAIYRYTPGRSAYPTCRIIHRYGFSWRHLGSYSSSGMAAVTSLVTFLGAPPELPVITFSSPILPPSPLPFHKAVKTRGSQKYCIMPPHAETIPLWFQCDYPDCSARYRRKEHLNRHRNHHDKEINLVCPYCESVLTRK